MLIWRKLQSLTLNRSIKVSDEPRVQCPPSHRNMSGAEDAFRNGIRARDGKYVISGMVNKGAYYDSWAGFDAAHIFPLEKESLWIQYNFGRYITDMDDTTGDSKIDSLQNGFILQATIHNLFDQYLLSVNPDVSIMSESISHTDPK